MFGDFDWPLNASRGFVKADLVFTSVKEIMFSSALIC